MNTENGKEIDFVVYEPVRRSDTNLTQITEQLPITKKFSGLYNRGKKNLQISDILNRKYMLFKLPYPNSFSYPRIP
jgi:hypothetical protein